MCIIEEKLRWYFHLTLYFKKRLKHLIVSKKLVNHRAVVILVFAKELLCRYLFRRKGICFCNLANTFPISISFNLTTESTRVLIPLSSSISSSSNWVKTGWISSSVVGASSNIRTQSASEISRVFNCLRSISGSFYRSSGRSLIKL